MIALQYPARIALCRRQIQTGEGGIIWCKLMSKLRRHRLVPRWMLESIINALCRRLRVARTQLLLL